MTPIAKYFLKITVPIFLLAIILPFIVVTNLVWVFVSFFLSYFFIYLIGYNFYHRMYAHRQFNVTNPKLHYVFGYLGMFCMLGDSLTYSLAHRYHHRYSDTEKDLHSPIKGKFHSTIGWFFIKNNLHLYMFMIKDYSADRYKILHHYNKYQILIIWITLIVLFLVSVNLVTGLIYAMIVSFLLEIFSNSYFNHSKKNKSAKDNFLYSVVSQSSLHKQHHNCPTDITETDPGRYLINICKYINVIK